MIVLNQYNFKTLKTKKFLHQRALGKNYNCLPKN